MCNQRLRHKRLPGEWGPGPVGAAVQGSLLSRPKERHVEKDAGNSQHGVRGDFIYTVTRSC